MSATIITKNSSTASAVPTAGQLQQGELAVNVTDRKLYTKNASGTVVGVGQEPLISGTNIKTVGGQSLLGSGDVPVGTGDVTLNGTQTLTNKTLGSGTVLGALVTGGDFSLTRTFFRDCGWDYNNAGDVSSIDYTNGHHQRWAPTGTKTLSITNWAPSGELSEILIEGVNLGGATLTWPTVNWINPNGSTTTSISTYLSNLSRSLQTSGIDWVVLWSRDAGTTIYGKLL